MLQTPSTLPGSTIRLLALDDMARWDQFVAASPQGNVFNRPVWLDALGVKRDILVVEDEAGIAAGMVLARGFLGAATNPMLVKHLGPLFRPFPGKPATRRSRERALAEALAGAVKGMRSFDYMFAPEIADWLAFYWQGFRQETRYTYRIRPEAGADWRKAGDTAMRNDCQRAARAGITVSEGSVEDLVAVVEATYRRQNTRAPIGGARLRAIATKLTAAGAMRIFSAHGADGGMLASCALGQDHRTAFLVLSGFHDGAPPGTTTLLIAHCIDATLGEGLAFDFEGSMIRPIERFYRGFGGELTPYSRIWRPSALNAARHTAYRVARRLLGYAR